MFENTAVFIRAKLSSTRLPRKHLLPVQGRPIIERLIDRIRHHTHIDTIVLCITDEESDDELAAIAQAYRIQCHRGKKGDVLRQYIDAAKEFNIKTIVNIDADDPLVDYTLIDETAELMRVADADYLTWEGYPLGCTPSGMSVFGLEWVAQKHKEAVEHIFAYLEQEPDITKLTIKEASPWLSKPYIKDIRLTLDYPEDYELLRIIYDNVYSGISDINFSELMAYIDANQHLLRINNFRNKEFRANQQAELNKKKQFVQPTEDEILNAYNEIKKRNHKFSHVSLQELYVQINTRRIIEDERSISIDKFKAKMLDFYDRHNMKDFEFAAGSGARVVCNKYGFLVGGRLMYYIQKLPGVVKT